MGTLKAASQLLAIAVAGFYLSACGKGGPNTANNTTENQYTQAFAKTPTNNVAPIAINQENATAVAGSALKALLLSDISANAIDRAVTVTREQNANVVDMATGIVITMQPVACLYNGSFAMQANLESTGENIQIDLSEDLKMSFSTTFDNCDQGGTSLHGGISIDFTAMINNLIAANNFSIDTYVNINQLSVHQSGFNPFVINGGLNYNISSPDGILITTDVSAENIYYSADNSYQVLEFESHKVVDLPTGEYRYTIYSSFVDQMIEGSAITYQTLNPVSGTGFSVPSSGSLIVYGANQTMTINIQSTESIEVSIDYENDNVIDDVIYSTWNDLALGSLIVP